MKNIKFVMLEKYSNTKVYSEVSKCIYKSIKNGHLYTTLSCDLEAGENEQYPLEDILDKYYVNCTDFFQVQSINGIQVLLFELEGSLGEEPEDVVNMQNLLGIIGKRVYNENEGGLIKLIVE